MNRPDEVIAMLLGDAPASAELRRWLRTSSGRRELAAYRETLGTLRRAYRDLRLPESAEVIFYRVLTTPVGRLLVAVSERGLVRVDFRRSESSFAAELRTRLHAEVVSSSEKTAPVAEQMNAYFAGERRRFDLPVDFRLTTPFQERVLSVTRRIPPGKVLSYAEVARRIGRPRASRAVGQALGRNPVPIVIPCHRVVASGGALGGYAGGLPTKKKLLRIEGALAS